MNLWWPRSVPYLTSEPSTNSNSDPDQPHPHPAPEPPRPEPAKQHSLIYPTPLKAGEFRLACLTAPPSTSSSTSPNTSTDKIASANYPVHLTLETYPLSNCPAYETVSYCWAGEDGDSTRRHPVFVGEYWDVMLHTRNCWELLRFVRPGRGVRMVWVDAVCIDQGCDEERAAQVAQMGRIYTTCTQVVVYLGPDVAPLLPEGKYPRRARLQEFGVKDVEKVSGVRGVKELLQRRYFSRLWVVQELILSPRVVIRIGDVDFQSDGATSGHLWESGSSELALAPWVQHTSNGAPLDMDLVQAMRLTFSAACADPRDRVFGIMGIISDKSWILQPEYSISVQDVFIGLSAYLLIVRGIKNLLIFSSGVSCRRSVPSWVPDWTTWDNWQAFIELESKKLRPVVRNLPLCDGISVISSNLTLPPYDFAFILPRQGYYGAAFAFILPRQGYYDAASQSQHTIFRVHPTTGILRAKMLLLLTLGSVPEIVGQVREGGPTLFEIRCRHYNVYLSCTKRLDTLVEPGKDHLYLLPLEDRDDVPGACILRSVNADDGDTPLRLVTTCEGLFFCVASPKDATGPESGWDGLLSPGGERQTYPRSSAEHGGLEYRKIDVCQLYWTLGYVIERAQAWLDKTLSWGSEDALFPPKYGLKRKDILPVYLAFFHQDFDKLLDTYEKYVTEQCAAEFRDNDLVFPVAYHTFKALQSWRKMSSMYSWVHWEEPARDAGSELRSQYTATPRIVVKISEIHSKLSTIQETSRTVVYMVRAASRRTGESVEQLLSRKSTEADYFVKVPTSSRAERFMDGGVGGGNFEYVNIV